MTKAEQLAKELSGCEYREEITNEQMNFSLNNAYPFCCNFYFLQEGNSRQQAV